jgi:hypothetical protein
VLPVLPCYTRPQTVHLTGLVPSTLYTVAFELPGSADAGADPVGRQWVARFQTLPPAGAPAAGPGATLVVLSCDRFVDDGDDGFWAALAAPYSAGKRCVANALPTVATPKAKGTPLLHQTASPHNAHSVATPVLLRALWVGLIKAFPRPFPHPLHSSAHIGGTGAHRW